MINLNPRALPVHCCCEPGKRLGWYGPVDERAKQRGYIRIVVTPPKVLLHVPGPPERVAGTVLDANIRTLEEVVRKPVIYRCDHGHACLTVPVVVRRLAIESMDQPIEVWRNIVGFTEDRYGKNQDRGREAR